MKYCLYSREEYLKCKGLRYTLPSRDFTVDRSINFSQRKESRRRSCAQELWSGSTCFCSLSESREAWVCARWKCSPWTVSRMVKSADFCRRPIEWNSCRRVLPVFFLFVEFSTDRCAYSGTPADADLAAFNSTCYEFVVKKGGSFQEARNYCRARGGDLVHGFQVSAAKGSFV